MAFLGLLIGLLVGLLLGAVLAIAFGVPFFIPGISAIVGPVVGGLTIVQAVILVVIVLLLLYLIAYALAVLALAPVPAPGAGPLPMNPTELLARGFSIGLTAALNASIWFVIGSPTIAILALIIVMAATIAPIARSPFFQAVLGWFEWLLPMSYLATIIGVLLFLVNVPFALLALGPGAFRVDWTTGVIETTGGILGITGFVGGFSLGNFNFLSPGAAPFGPGLAAQSAFAGPTISAHEIGHSLNTAAMGGVVLWINAVDENIPPPGRGEAAYGELLAQSHAPGGSSPSVSGAVANFVRIWS